MRMHNFLQKLKDCTDHGELKSQLETICSRFGPVVRLDVLIANQAGKRQALCFLRLHSEEQERHLINELSVGRFGGDIVVVIDLNVPTIESPVLLTPQDGLCETDRYQRGPAVQAVATL